MPPINVQENLKKFNIPEQEYFLITERIGRQLNETELYMFSAMWSEHCSYKHSKIALKKLPKTGGIFTEENSGGVAIGDYVLFFKVESHNHPCAVEPYNGAATGIGGITRDILAMNARPIALLNSLKFGPLSEKRNKYLFERVVDGISDYGNCTGISTIGGEVLFDEAYSDSPLVNVMAVGIAHKDNIIKSAAKPGYKIILVGSHTGLDGVGGASFASKELSDESAKDKPCVQIGDPFMKKKLIEATLEILKSEDIIACQDCGAAGLLSSTVEMAHKGNCGIRLFLENVHTGTKNIEPWQIMLSETQERMIFITNDNGIETIKKLSEKFEVPHSIVGETIDEKVYQLFQNNELFADLTPEILCNPPFYKLESQEPEYIKNINMTEPEENISVKDAVIKMLKNPSLASKKWIYEQFDHKVGNRCVIPPGENSSALWIHENESYVGFSIDSRPFQVYLAPYQGTANTVFESYRNLISNGFEPLGITNCLNYANPEKNDCAYQFVESIEGIQDTCFALNVPVVSGNVSFYNESEKHKVYPTPTIAMAGSCDSLEKIIRSNFNEGETILLIGKDVYEESNIGGSLYQKILFGFIGGEVDYIDFNLEIRLEKSIKTFRNQKLLGGCIDVSSGGIFVALLRALIKNNVGFEGSLINCKSKLKSLFGEINGQYLISTNNKDEIINILNHNHIHHRELGKCIGDEISFDGYSFAKNELFRLYKNSLEEIMQ